ncbi:MAG: GWxTD domain-containing protein [Cytophagales bacterium]|nr:GWxTD domain-containing protein [Cytophagales bacterium]
MLKKAIISFVTIFSLLSANGQVIFDRNLDYQYDLNPNISNKHIVLDEDDSLKVYATFHIKRLEGQNARYLSSSRFDFKYLIYSDYNSTSPISGDSLYRLKTNFKPDKAQIWFSFKLPKPQIPSAILFLSVHDSELDETTIFDIKLSINNENQAMPYGIFTSKGKEPIFSNYFTTKDTVQFRKMTDRFQKLIVFRYKHEFAPASPPMLYVPVINSNMAIDSIFSVYSDSPLRFKKEAFYFAQEDTTTSEGFCFTVKEAKYPRITRAKEMIGPLAYITKDEEYEELVKTKSPKAAIDDFWQNFGVNDPNAKKQIKQYYNRVEKANELFTTYKEGWKTDMGMAYILFGKPTKVLRSLEKEDWTYLTSNNSQLIFTFRRKPNIFYSASYELEREKFYESSYLSIVQQWRKGIPQK